MTRRPAPTHYHFLEPLRTRCPHCQGPLWAAYMNLRTVTTLRGVYRLTLRIRRCVTPSCPRYHLPSRPEEESG